MNVLERMFPKPEKQIIYKIVERHRESRTPKRWGSETREAVAALQTHPGFIALMEELQMSRDMLDSQLKTNMHRDLQTVGFLQSGYFWSGWLQEKVNKAMNRPSAIQVDPMQEELDAFNEINNQIERVGMDE